ncbi:hypothetical protein ERO13_D04G065866v2 [Gossypium hirsutum]|uniref:Uncharacterized protein n=4 Tax=Gossypium TaxID=3633 RepID=A0A0D2TK65_GOSRA|nr:hypothetical protein ES319_D04G074200v1 [Gossypium barbadense]KAG4151458.1 hypothetical protein ERO13_D04G065866v2 [Gossypium hirsutum]KJB76133.1 hypothetical protein B456_012G074200 [Gossypium raimondii]TYH76341.1 hypothetical protein ES332_D04G078600v1 [Gossypium tomentosum]TYI86593.1 hypothetical protein E1A91_D04G075500v1 [Gossypium mustelinum]
MLSLRIFPLVASYIMPWKKNSIINSSKNQFMKINYLRICGCSSQPKAILRGLAGDLASLKIKIFSLIPL